eukprot:3535360-Pyramimonas_sp.AAC.1
MPRFALALAGAVLLDSVAFEVEQPKAALLAATAHARLRDVVVEVAVNVALLKVVVVATVLPEVALLVS